MSKNKILSSIDHILDAPGSVQSLRQFMLKLAVRGKLVDRDPNDEPSSELLRRLRVERAHLEKLGKIKKRTLPLMREDSVPFLAPQHWEWVQLVEVGGLAGGMTPSKSRPDFWGGDINWFSPKDFRAHELIESELKITPAGVAGTGLQIYPPECLFVVARSGILKRKFPVAINRVEGAVNQDLKVLVPFIDGMERYLQVMFWGMEEFVLASLVKTGTTVQSLKYEEFEVMPVPLPPIAEQQRIVAKVEEVNDLCARLEAAQAEQASVTRQLREAVLHEALAGF